MRSDNILEYKLKQCIDITFKDRLCTNSTDKTVTLVIGDIKSILFVDELGDLCVVRGRVSDITYFYKNDKNNLCLLIDYSRPNRSNKVLIYVNTILDIQEVDFDYKVGFEERYNEQARANFGGERYANINDELFVDLSFGARVRPGGKERMEHEELVFKAMKNIKELF